VVVTTISLDKVPSNAGTKAVWGKYPLDVANRHHLAQQILLLLRIITACRQGITDEARLILVQTIYPVVSYLSKDFLSANVQNILDRCGEIYFRCYT